MANSLKAEYGSASQAITITLSSLANGSAREGVYVDNSSNLYLDALLQLKWKTGAASTSATGYVQVLAAGSVDTHSTFGGGLTGADAAITLVPSNARANLVEIGRVQVAADATTYYSPTMSVAAAFDGKLPQYWTIVVINNGGGTSDTTSGNFSVLWQGVRAQVV